MSCQLKTDSKTFCRPNTSFRKQEENPNRSEQMAPEVLALLESYSWPGNVRELENTVERAVVIAPGNEISKECLRPEISDPRTVASTSHDGASIAAVHDIGRGINFYEEVRRFEIDLIRRALEQTGGHQSRAARLLGMNATTLNSKIKTYNISLRS
jgi:DNA-binding NtrC family response regulator